MFESGKWLSDDRNWYGTFHLGGMLEVVKAKADMAGASMKMDSSRCVVPVGLGLTYMGSLR